MPISGAAAIGFFPLVAYSLRSRPADLSELMAPPPRQAAIRAEIAAVIAGKTRDEWAAIFAAHDCCCEPVLELDELAGHPLHQAREVFVTVDGGAAGPLRQLRTPLGPPARLTAPPTHGQHSREVLGEYGFAADEIAKILS